MKLKLLKMRLNNTARTSFSIHTIYHFVHQINRILQWLQNKYLKGIPAWQSEPFLESDWWLMLIWWFHPPEYSLKILHFLWLILHSVLTIFYKIQLQNVIKNYLFETQNIIFNILFTIWFIAYKILANKSKKDEESEVL